VLVATKETETAHSLLLSLIHINVKVDQLLRIIEPGVRNTNEMEVAQLSIHLAEVVQTLSNFFPAEDIVILGPPLPGPARAGEQSGRSRSAGRR